MKKAKRVIIFLSLIFSTLLLAQKQENLLEVEFAYLSRAKLNKTNSFIHEEIFLLQVLKDKAFFFSENMAKYDSIFRSEIKRVFEATPKGSPIHITPPSNLPNTKFHYVIAQSSQSVEYLEKIGGERYSYSEPVIKDWKLINESQTINTFSCKKATLHYKGRDWVAWYTPEIPLPYGPYKFTGLPGLVVKIESEDGEFSFELVKSTPKDKLNGKELSLQDSRYKKATTASFAEIRKIKKNNIERLVVEAANMGIDTSAENTRNLLQRQKQKLQNFENENLIEKIEN